MITINENTLEDTIAEKLTGTQLYASAEGFVGKIVTIRNAEARDTVITGKVTEAKLTETEGVLHVAEIRIAEAGAHELWTPFKDTKYAAKKWYWTVESIN